MCYDSVPGILCLKREARCLKFTAVVFRPLTLRRGRDRAMPSESVLLTLAEMNGTVSGANCQGLAPTVHLSVDLRGTERSFDCYGESQADVSVVRARVDVGLQVSRDFHVHAAIAGTNRPRRLQLRTRGGSRVHASVAGFDTQRIEAPFQVNVPVAARRLDASVEAACFDVAIASVEADCALDALHRNAPIAGG